MYLFSAILLPCFTLGYCFSDRTFSYKSYIPLVFLGLTAAALTCTVQGLFIYTSYIWKVSFPKTFLHIYIIEEFIPILIIFSLFFFFSKDSKDFKINSIIPLAGSFFSITIPYSILSKNDIYSFYMLFSKPISIVLMIVVCQLTIRQAFASKEIKFNPLLIITFLNTLVPAAIEAQWHTSPSRNTIIIETLIYLILAAGIIFISKTNKVQAKTV